MTPTPVTNTEFDEIQKFMTETYNRCLKMAISISINIKTGRMQWSKR
jgi:hypothetical protein